MRATAMATAALILIGCQQAETPAQLEARMASESADAKAAIEAVNQEFAGHLNQGHADVAAGFYTEDAVVMAPNVPAAMGREAIKGVLSGLASMQAQLHLVTESVVANGPLAVERGVYHMSVTPAGAAAAVADTGKYLVHWRKVGDRWLLADDIFNSDLPLPAPPPAK